MLNTGDYDLFRAVDRKDENEVRRLLNIVVLHPKISPDDKDLMYAFVKKGEVEVLIAFLLKGNHLELKDKAELSFIDAIHHINILSYVKSALDMKIIIENDGKDDSDETDQRVIYDRSNKYVSTHTIERKADNKLFGYMVSCTEDMTNFLLNKATADHLPIKIFADLSGYYDAEVLALIQEVLLNNSANQVINAQSILQPLPIKRTRL